MNSCECQPCPGRGNDGHGLTHCAECCFGTGVEADLDCPTHGMPAPNACDVQGCETPPSAGAFCWFHAEDWEREQQARREEHYA